MLSTPNTCSYLLGLRFLGPCLVGLRFLDTPKKVLLYLFLSKSDLILFGDLKFKLVQLSSFYHCHFGEKYGQPLPPKTHGTD